MKSHGKLVTLCKSEMRGEVNVQDKKYHVCSEILSFRLGSCICRVNTESLSLSHLAAVLSVTILGWRHAREDLMHLHGRQNNGSVDV